MIRKIKNIVHLQQARRAAKKYGYPEQDLKVIGVTGTDGKTTSVSMLYHILHNCGLKVGYVSTTEARIGKNSLDTGFHVTSPDPWDLPKYLRMMVDQNTEFAILETTSHGLHQHRYGDIKFDACIITNIREDHLDYHKTWENYAKAKFGLLSKLKQDGVAILNADDEKSARWLRKKSAELKQTVYVKWASRDLVADVSMSLDRLDFNYGNLRFSVPIIGTDYNLSNCLQAIMLAESLIPLGKIRDSLSSLTLPKGRMQLILAEPIKIIVDFAHTPAALENSLLSLRKLLPKGRRVITVFGCAGKRDKGRRRMGMISAELADLTVLTAEDPRGEKLSQVNTEIFNTAKALHGKIIQRFTNHDDYSLTSLGEIHAVAETAWKHEQKPFICFDEDNKNSRRDAIELAIRMARRGDCVFITGKGHEQSLAFGKEEKEYAWSDQDEVKLALKRLKIS